ncbi:DNA-3-methyladenine glycosylase 2 family protein [Candidatus Kaiserbacteria bacterium]|nr:DNA-3-methyladenine glycosylase 2 family protein [Candidatus Kaiserbacteria bacterium]
MTSLINTAAALKYFKQNDTTMYNLLSKSLKHEKPISIPKPRSTKLYFESLVNAIIGQQISTVAAAAIRKRVHVATGNINPANVSKIHFDKLKACGLSEKKTRYIKENAVRWHEIPYGNFVHMTDHEIITELTKLYGIGKWTAEMFLIFTLARPDVYSYGDLGLTKSLQQNYNYKPHFVRKIHTTVENWSPHQTLASLALWHQKDNSPES